MVAKYQWVSVLWAMGVLIVFTLASCRSQLGGKCSKKGECALGLYCDLEKEVCADRGQLLKTEAEKVYVYPIPSKTKPK